MTVASRKRARSGATRVSAERVDEAGAANPFPRALKSTIEAAGERAIARKGPVALTHPLP